MVNLRTTDKPGGLLRRAQTVLLLALVLLLVVPGIAHADNVIKDATTHDLNANGHIDQIAVTLTTDPGAVTADQFTVAGYTVTGVNGSGTARSISVGELATFDTGARPTISFYDGTGTTTLAAGNGTATDTYKDGAAPVLLQPWGDDFGAVNVFGDANDMVTFRFSEAVTLNANATPAPQNPAASTPVTGAPAKKLALEQALVISGVAGCAGDGDGTPTGGSNFPTQGASNTVDPIAFQNFGQTPPTAALTEGDEIVVTFHAGDTMSSKKFAVRPAVDVNGNPLSRCTAGIPTAHQANILDKSKNMVVIPASPPTIVLQRGLLTGAPATADLSTDGKIDQVTLTLNHNIDPASVTSGALGRFSLVDPTDASVHATNLSFPAGAASGATLKLNFTPAPSWNTGTRPIVNYDDSGACLASGIRIIAPSTEAECAAAFSKQADDKAAPIALSAATVDQDANGKLDGVEVTWSENVTDSSFGTAGGFSVTDYTPNAVETAGTVDDQTLVVKFSEVGYDTQNTPNINYTAPETGGAVDTAGNAIAAFFAPLQAVDGASPVLVGGSVYDVMKGTTANTHDGKIDEAVFTFSEPIKDSSIAANKFHIGAATANTLVAAPVNTEDARVANDQIVTLRVDAGIVGTEAKALTVDTDAVKDMSADAISSGAVTLAAGSVADHAAPMVLTVTPTGQSTDVAAVAVNFSEPMATDALTVSYDGAGLTAPVTIPADAAEGHTNGWRADDASVWEGVAPAPASGQCNTVTGCAYVVSISGGKGIDNNTQALSPDMRFGWTIDTIAPAAPAITAPGVNQTLTTAASSSRDVVVNGTASETGLTIRIVQSGRPDQLVKSGSATGHPWSVTLQDESLGSHSITVTAIDAGTNVSPSVTRTFWVKQATSITLNNAKTLITYGQTTSLSGTLKNAAGQAMPNTSVVIQGTPYGSHTWRNLVTLTTNAQGNFSWTTAPPSSYAYQAVYAGTPTVAGVISTIRRTEERVAISARLSSARISLGQTFTVLGSIRPGKSGKTMRLQQWTSTGWKTVGFNTLDGYSNYRFNYRPSTRGTYKFRVFYAKADALHLENSITWTESIV